jgi:hypothetical protein
MNHFEQQLCSNPQLIEVFASLRALRRDNSGVYQDHRINSGKNNVIHDRNSWINASGFGILARDPENWARG